MSGPKIRGAYIFNSTLLNYYYNITYASTKTVFTEIGARQVQNLPIKQISLKNKEEKKIHDQLVQFVSQMLETKRQLKQAKTEGNKTFLENKCASLDRQIDNLVYQLYDLTEEEIKIVEGKQ